MCDVKSFITFWQTFSFIWMHGILIQLSKKSSWFSMTIVEVKSIFHLDSGFDSNNHSRFFRYQEFAEALWSERHCLYPFGDDKIENNNVWKSVVYPNRFQHNDGCYHARKPVKSFLSHKLFFFSFDASFQWATCWLYHFAPRPYFIQIPATYYKDLHLNLIKHRCVFQVDYFFSVDMLKIFLDFDGFNKTICSFPEVLVETSFWIPPPDH